MVVVSIGVASRLRIRLGRALFCRKKSSRNVYPSALVIYRRLENAGPDVDGQITEPLAVGSPPLAAAVKHAPHPPARRHTARTPAPRSRSLLGSKMGCKPSAILRPDITPQLPAGVSSVRHGPPRPATLPR